VSFPEVVHYREKNQSQPNGDKKVHKNGAEDVAMTSSFKFPVLALATVLRVELRASINGGVSPLFSLECRYRFVA
jgi:hypothetical protein